MTVSGVGRGRGAEQPLSSPAVAAEIYDRDYFLGSCMGAREWRESGGEQVSGLYPGALLRAGMKPHWRVLDIGTGRADLIRAAVEMGASEAVGVDYSEAAIELGRETLRRAGNPPAARIALADARRIPVDDDHFDLVTLLDVVEHLTPHELGVSLGEAMRALRPGGRLFIHTVPNATVYDTTYRIQRRVRPGRSRTWPADPRNEFERTMHVNEHTVGSIRRALREAGFAPARAWLGDWVYTDFVPEPRAQRLYRALARVPLLRRFGVIEIFATGEKPSPRPLAG